MIWQEINNEFLNNFPIQSNQKAEIQNQMSTKKSSTIRKVAWISLFPQLLVMAILFLFYYMLDIENPLMGLAITYLLLSLSLRTLIPRNHREGISLVGKKRFAAAIPEFEDSYRFFDKYNWVDKYRYITILSSSAVSFREMALCNIAYCYTELNNIEQAKKYYQRTLEEFSESGLAKAGLQYIEQLENNKKD